MMPNAIGYLVLLPFLVTNVPSTFVDENIEHLYRPKYLELATGTVEKFHQHHGAYPWPVSLISIGNAISSYQLYTFNPNDAYFHHGIDMRADAGSPVYVSVGGKIVDIVNYQPGQDAYWEIAILDKDGFLWQYHHIDRTSMPDSLFEALQNGTPIADGTKLGEVYYWPIISEGERYNHIHVNVIGKDKTFLNGLNFLTPLDDKTQPIISNVALLKNGRKVPGSRISGDYSVMAEVKDLTLSNSYYLPPYTLSYELDDGAPVVVWTFDTLPGKSSDTDYVNTLFVRSEVCGDYQCRKPVIDLGFNLDQPRKFPSTSGDHKMVIRARDFQGNETSQEFRWSVE